MDESGFYPLPAVVRTYAPRGQTPVLREWCTRDHLSVIAAVRAEGEFHARVQERAFDAVEDVELAEPVRQRVVADRMLRLQPLAVEHVPVLEQRQQARLVRGQSVLIHGAAGNVGAYAVQLAKGAGIRVSATAGAADLAYVRDLGADAVIDYRTTAFEDAVRDVDAVIDLVGGAVQDRSFAVLRRGGRLISAVSQPDQMLAERAGVEAKFFLIDVTSADLAQLATMLDDGSLTTTVGTVLSFGDARIAHEMLEGARPRPRGKIVLKVDP